MQSSKGRDILFISSWFPNRTNPTLGNFVERHARAVALQNRVFCIHTVPEKGRKTLEFDLKIEGNFASCILYHPPLRPHRLFRSFFLKKAYHHLQKHIKMAPDVVHLNIIHPAGRSAAAIARSLNIPLVITEHWTGYHPETHNSLTASQWKTIRAIAREAKTLCPVSQQLVNSMKSREINGEYRVVPNVVDTQLFQITLSNDQRKRFRFLHVSTLLDSHKNISGMLRAFKNALDEFANMEIAFIGEGDRAVHQSYADELGIDREKISFQGTSPIESIAEAMQNSDCFVLFSNYENLPCVIGESFASGIPVISTDVGGINEHLNSERGILIEKGNENALTEAMLQVAKNGATFDRNSLRTYAEKHFSQEAICAAFNEVYAAATKSSRT